MNKKEKSDLTIEVMEMVINEIKKNYFLVERNVELGQEVRPEFIEIVIAYVCLKTGVSENLIKSESRSRDVVKARSIVSYIVRECCYGVITFKLIGKFLNKNHATIIHGIRALCNDMERDVTLREYVNDMKTSFKLDFKEKIFEISNPKIIING